MYSGDFGELKVFGGEFGSTMKGMKEIKGWRERGFVVVDFVLIPILLVFLHIMVLGQDCSALTFEAI